MLNEKTKIIVILGPTASGKSELAVKIALRLRSGQAKKYKGAEIISADSRQVYKGLDIGSGKITQKEMQGIPPYCIDVASPKKIFTAQDFKKLGQKAISDIVGRRKIPIICGGTGFYIDALLGVKEIPEIPPDWPLRKKLEKKTTEELFRILKKLNSRRTENIDSKNRRRLIRAIEISESGDATSSRGRISEYDTLFLGLTHSPEILKKRIEKRVETMLKKGLIKEVKKLRAQGLSWKRISELGFEYKYPALYLQKKISKEEMTESLKTQNWRYAKRQMTWFKRNPNIYWIKSSTEAKKLIKEFV
ncbi:MAG: tRNA dimethylallyltransferase [Parcubacteria group bacterium GW2011_GWB1_41_6]|nr:MAG: tRNA dimethylallyltransferase [Parcubacteria group bacterium GW2011_GWB1_41_6]